MLVTVSFCLCRPQGQDSKHSTSGILPLDGSGDSSRKSPHFPAPFCPPGGPFVPSFWRGAHKAQEGIKGQVEGAQVQQDSPVPGLDHKTLQAR